MILASFIFNYALLFVISIFLNYASIILYYLHTTEFLFIKILVQSSQNFVLRAVYSDCILKGLEAVSSCFFFLIISLFVSCMSLTNYNTLFK